MRLTPLAALGFAALIAPASHAAERTSAPVLLGPEVVKLDWGTRGLIAHDLDRDGRQDLLVVNNDRASIEILYQRDPAAPIPPRKASATATNRWEPDLEDARFRKETLIVGQNLFHLVVADFNGDGRPDIAATGDPVPLQVRYARADGGWDEIPFATAPEPARFLGSAAVGVDIDRDERADLVVLGQTEIAIFRQRAGFGLVLDEKVPLADDNAYGLLITDFDGDGRVDLSYLVPGGRESLRVRLQAADGKFGPEVAFPLKTPRSPLLVVPEGAVTDPDAGSGSTPTGRGPLLASVLGGSGQVEFTRLVPAESDDRWSGLAPRAFSPLAGARGPALYTTGDFNRDGASDVAVAFGETAQIFIYLRDSDGGFTLARRVPSLTDAKGLAALSWSAGEFSDRLFVLSGKENALAEIALADDGTALPPRALSIPGRLIGFAAGNLSSGLPGFAVVAEEDAKRALTLWTRDAQGVLVRGAAFSLATLRTDPRSVTLGDLNQDGRADVLLGVPAVGVRVLLQTADGGLVDAADNPAYRPGLLGRPEVISAPLSWGDVDGDGKDELLVGAENFIRALRIDESGALAIAAQFDARDIAAEVTTGFVLAGGKAATDAPRVILYDRKADQLHLLERAPGDPAYETSDVRSVARLDVVGATQLRGPEGRRELLLLGRDRFWWMPEGGADFALQSETLYASDLPEVRYLYAAVGDFDRDGRSDLVALDTAKNLVEILSTDSTGGWVPQLHFRVFETDPHFSGDRGGGQEPRECVIADINADGKPDLVLLVHDRVLVYPQE